MICTPKKFEEEDARLVEEYFSVENREESVQEFLDKHMSEEYKDWLEAMDKHREEMEKIGVII